MIQFRQKDFSNYILKDTLRGAGIGLSIGALASGLGVTPEKIPTWIPGSKKYNDIPKVNAKNKEGNVVNYVRTDKHIVAGNDKHPDSYANFNTIEPMVQSGTQKVAFAAGTTLLGAFLGLVVGAIRTAAANGKLNPPSRLLNRILPKLKADGLVEGKDFTMDPKKANEIPTKVCIVISSASGELQTVINTKDDSRLKGVVDKVVKKSPGRSQVSTQNNRFNEITITTEKNAAANVNQVVSIIESFVESGYPVYLVEVG